MSSLDKYPFLKELGINEINSGACYGPDNWLPTENRDLLDVVTPIDGSIIAKVAQASKEDYELVASKAQEAFQKWRMTPAPKRGEIVREIGDEIRKNKEPLGMLITLEMGKIKVEGMGEVQEAIDVADMAVGMSRQLFGLSMHSERPGHQMIEQWHPLGVVGVITAFNFPMAVWAWNSMIAAICGDTILWKPSSQTPLCAIALQNIANKVMKNHGLEGIFNLTIGRGSVIGDLLINDRRISLISATGSTRMGYQIAEAAAKRLCRTILELGGNNGIIVMEDADLDLALRAIVFGAVGTAGQRCTTTRRIIAHESIIESLTEKLVNAYKQVKIGDPLDSSYIMGPVVNQSAIDDLNAAIEKLPDNGGELLYGGERLDRPGFYVTPAVAKVPGNTQLVCHETFAPLLYIMPCKDIDDAIEKHNGVPQGLSSAIFTNNLKYSSKFLSHIGSDCGIANVNIGTSGAEIGGAFGGHKDTGWGSESGSDSWKQYMRRQTNTTNWSDQLPLAQGIDFGV
jgi:aldehyde dehydrogenase (NAD+)